MSELPEEDADYWGVPGEYLGITRVRVENVFYCSKDEVAFTSTADAKSCNVCEESLKCIGWFESEYHSL